MATVDARVWAQQCFGYVEHTAIDGETWQFISTGTTTSAGAANGTTVIDTYSPSGGADTYNGRYWVHVLSGSNLGAWKRIVDDDGAGTLTLENNGFDNQVGSGVSYEIWKSPEPVIVVDSSSGETDCVDAVRADADLLIGADQWIGYYVVPITGTRRGKTAKITGFTSGTGTFVLATGLGGALVAGDVCLLRKWVEVSDLKLPTGYAYHKRPQNRVNFGVGDGHIGAKSGEISFNTHIYGSGTLVAADASATASVLSGLFGAAGLEEIVGKGMTVDSSSTTTAIKVSTAKWENSTIGTCVSVNGNIRRITAQTDGAALADTVTVSPALPYAPTAADIVRPMRTYQKSVDGDGMYGVTIEIEVDGVRWTLTGCKGNVTLADGDLPTLQWAFQCDHWIRDYEAIPYAPTYTSANPVLASDRRAWLSTTGVDIKGFTATPGTKQTRKAVQGASGVNGGAGFHVTDYECSATFRELLGSSDDSTFDLAYDVRTSYALLVVWGSQSGSAAFAVTIPTARMIQPPNPENGDGLVEFPRVLEAQDSGYTTDGASASVKIPDFAFHVL